MFILRRITSENRERNDVIGNHYQFVRKLENKDEFLEFQDLLGWEEDDLVYAFVVYNQGQDILPLYKPSVYFMMTSDGKTFANLTFR